MIAFDTETTGLPIKGELSNPLKMQPHIIEFAAIKLDDTTLEETDRLHFFCKPPISIPAVITKITGIDDAKVADWEPFARYYPKLREFFLGEKQMVAHNIQFDRDLVSFELRRIDKLMHFPWPYIHHCTVDLMFSVSKFDMKMSEAYEHVTSTPLEGAHSGIVDVVALVEVIRWLRKENKI